VGAGGVSVERHDDHFWTLFGREGPGMIVFDLLHSQIGEPIPAGSPCRRGRLGIWRSLAVLIVLAFGAGALCAAGQARQAGQSQRLPALEVLERAHTQFSQGDYQSARRNYLKVLPSFPANFDVLRDLGYCYFVMGPRGFALAAKYYARAYEINPHSTEVANRLSQCYMALKEYREAAAVEMKLADLPGSPAGVWKRAAEAYAAAGDHSDARKAYIAYLQRKPGDLLARCQLARMEGLDKNYNDAAVQYRIVLSSNPNFIPALTGMARIDSWQGQLDTSLELYNRVLRLEPENYEALQGKAFVLFWKGNYEAAQAIFERLTKMHPNDAQNSEALKDIARAQEAARWNALRPTAGASPQLWIDFYRKRLESYPKDREALKGLAYQESQLNQRQAAVRDYRHVLEIYPDDRDSKLELARLYTKQGQYSDALKEYEDLLKRNPQDPAALQGKARISFYQGNLSQAHAAAKEAVEKSPDDFSSLFLLASIEHAQHHRRKTLNLLKQAEKLSPGDAEVASLRNRVLSESRVTLTTTVAYTREIGPPSQVNGRTGLPNEDLRMFTYGTTIGMNLFPATNSYFSFTSAPSDSPAGPLRDSFGNQIPTGITGATAPYSFLYRQSTRFGHWLTIRGGAGFTRFGPGEMVPIPGQNSLVKGAAERPVGLAGVSIGLIHGLTLDLDATKSAITYTPVSTRLGVIRDRLRGRLNFFFNPRTSLHLAYWYGRYTSEVYYHTVVVNGVSQDGDTADRDHGVGGRITFNGQVLHSSRLSLDLGYEGDIYGFAGQGQNLFMGFFSPSFYQSHELVPRIYGSLWGPLGYDLSGGIGIQQTGRGAAVTNAWMVSPNILVRVSRHLSLIFGYTHYNTAQILGPLRGNEVRFGTKWQY
jgi:tetratricopeptide (TPR) repeat protein